MKMMHVTLYVKDIDASIEFYRTVAGFSIVNEKRSGENRVVFLNDGSQDFCLELAKGYGDMVFEGKCISLGLACEDLEAERKRLADLGIEVGEVISPRPDVHFFFITDPDGFTIQFMQV